MASAAEFVQGFGALLPPTNLTNVLVEIVRRQEAFEQRIDARLDEFAKAQQQLESKVTQLQDSHIKLADTVAQQHKEVKAELAEQLVLINKQKEDMERLMVQMDRLDKDVAGVKTRTAQLEEEMPLKASKVELDTAIAEINKKLEDMNIEEIMEMAKRANERIDLMDERCDRIDDSVTDLKAYVLKKEKEMEDLGLEAQINTLKEELEAAKTGVFLQATARMDVMQKDADDLKDKLTQTSGQSQVNRENILELEDLVRQSGGKIGNGTGGTRALVERLQEDVQVLQSKYATALAQEAKDSSKHQETNGILAELRSKLSEIETAKADRSAVDIALVSKADKEAVARDVAANQRAVDEALNTMNAGTQGIQQLLEHQEGVVSRISTELETKPTRQDLMAIQEQLRKASANGEPSAEQKQAIYGKYGLTPQDAAGMVRPAQKYNCISCNRPLKVEQSHAVASLPLLKAVKDQSRQPPHISAKNTSSAPRLSRSSSATLGRSYTGDSIVEVSELPSSMRTAGGAYTSPRKSSMGSKPRPRPPSSSSPERTVKLVGEDGRIYKGS